jgi:predicted PurR-regulated permease PerM
LGSLVSSAGVLVIGCVLAVFMLLFLLKEWDQIIGWVAGHLGAPAPIGDRMVNGIVSAFRGYAWGLTCWAWPTRSSSGSVHGRWAFLSPSRSPWCRS